MVQYRFPALLLALVIALSLTGCSAEQTEKQSAVGFYLDTVIMLTAYVDDAQVLNDALVECGRYERMLSRTIEGSDVWRINHAEGQPVEVLYDPDDPSCFRLEGRSATSLLGNIFLAVGLGCIAIGVAVGWIVNAASPGIHFINHTR